MRGSMRGTNPLTPATLLTPISAQRLTWPLLRGPNSVHAVWQDSGVGVARDHSDANVQNKVDLGDAPVILTTNNGRNIFQPRARITDRH